ncbi:NADH-quinone oxidoreductase subunit NuoE [Neisseria leonii]|uniref:NADH-quinone oxidoreductase subunit NuoE n=1 Tax=Neisseria leonii TaxID=2995413 RepID=UPI00237B5246|nr:NADH-quinone oxidoreductase subunit NuoE [Neisseria sp. 3986]MDD9326027.1 NADH-quinone oxidoreductase subunit NuoE [Neisseria sp. 3986]
MLSAESLQQIDTELAKYPADQRRSAIMGALRIAQTEKGWLSVETIEYVAGYVGIPPAAAYEVATFYNMYDLAPVGKYKLTVCTNLPCALRGGVDAADYLKSKLGIGFGETTPDGRFTLLEGECMGACGDAPVMLLNNHKMCSFMTEEAIEKKLAELQ